MVAWAAAGTQTQLCIPLASESEQCGTRQEQFGTQQAGNKP